MTANFAHTELPHPPGRRRVLGDVVSVMRAPGGGPVQKMLHLSKGAGPLFELRTFGMKFVLTTDAALTAELSDEGRFQKALAPGVKALREVAGDGLFTAYTDEPNWALAHDLLLPAFTRASMRGYHDTMNAVCSELISAWDQESEPVDVSPWLTRMTLETIGRTSFSTDFGSFTSDEQHPFVTAMITALAGGQRRAFLSAVPGGRLLMRRGRKVYDDRREYVDAMIDDIVEARRASGDRRTDDLLGLMLNSRHPDTGAALDLTNVRYQINTFLVAGHETTSGALSFALYYMSRDGEVMRRAQEEADAILGTDPDAVPTFEQVPKFRYIRRCLDEALRLWPTAPGFARGPRHGSETIGGRWTLHRDDWVLVMLTAVHRDPSVWGADAESYDPDHFLPANVRARPAHSYLPFGVGDRACIGRQFALHESVLALARLVHRYDLTPDPSYDLRIAERLTLMPRDFRLGVTRRTPKDVARSTDPRPSEVETASGISGCPVAH
ncbi:cytochrome P450 [Allobranchiibius sp. GilTou38]|uniref:cytochrome P450 n=1 Tax=Allobranchiibius sp. GilTou38 TaxID=2815210 RepID=UPI001AA1A4AB|nr:cytochrome P450 [Allobranchiibius sp. GilTou38]MBO1766983.1 cytochrome P450 [Allobranchiibius sp. GilTou38]